MGYNNKISRSRALDADQKIVNEIIQGAVEGSAILPLMRRLPNMVGKQAKMPVLDALPEAYWVSGDEGLKQTTEMAWKNKYIYAEELAVVVPISEAVLSDSEYDIWAEVKPRIVEAMYKKVDEAIIKGTSKPQTWREGLIPSIINAGNAVTPSSDSLFVQVNNAMGKVETDGFEVNGLLGGLALKASFREGLRDTTGQPLTASEITELPRKYAKNGAWDATLAKFIVGDFTQAVYSIRQDVEFKLFDSGVVTDGSGNIIYNLMQQDMVALRVTFRMGWELPNPINAGNSDPATRFPFALVYPADAPTTYNVVFTVTDTSSTAVANAYIDFGGQILKTDSNGQATFKSVGNATYNYSVDKGTHHAEGSKAVETSNTTVSVTNF